MSTEEGPGNRALAVQAEIQTGGPRCRTVQSPRLSQDSFESLREELERTRTELAQARARIAAMEMSFFWKLRNAWWRLKGGFAAGAASDGRAAPPVADTRVVQLAGLAPVCFRGPTFDRSSEAVDAVVLGHDDLSVLEECLGALLRRARPPYTLFLADPGVSPAVRDWLEAFSRDQGAHLVSGADAFARAVEAGTGGHVLLLDGRARVGADFLDRLAACLASDEDTAGVVPLAADVPLAGSVFERAVRAVAGRDKAPATLLAAESARLFPPLEAGGGCAVLVRRSILPPGTKRSPREFLEVLRVGGKSIRLADDAWFEGVAGTSEDAPNRVVLGIATRFDVLPERVALRERARRRFEGKRVLYVLPVLERGGGSNVVLSEARAMTRMGVEARVFNLAAHRTVFERSYPAPGVPVLYGRESDLVEAARGFDGVIGTAHYSVPWMLPLAKLSRPPVLGYCIQDYEPLFYAEDSPDFKRAFASYGLVPGMKRFSKSRWNADEVIARTGLDCALVAASFDADVFRPRLSQPAASPVRIAAMVRPSTPRRQPGLTVDVMRALAQKLGDRVEVVLFGSDRSDPALRALRLDFPHRFAGVLDERELSALLSQVHVFADLSAYQALGVASLEAMASGAAVVVPRAGGADTFARHDVNALFVDTSSKDACVACLERLATDGALLGRLAAQAIADAGLHTPDRAAAGILEVLFGAP
jgi:glycosyltransferase involved in cell wall biosynthesis